MVLADDNFASIVAAVREGRGIFDNIRKTLVYLLAGNAAELMVMLVAALADCRCRCCRSTCSGSTSSPTACRRSRWSMDPADADVLRRPPRPPDEPMLGRDEWRSSSSRACCRRPSTLGVFVWALSARDLAEARNLAFSVLVFGELFRAFAARSTTRVFWEVGAFTQPAAARRGRVLGAGAARHPPHPGGAGAVSNWHVESFRLHPEPDRRQRAIRDDRGHKGRQEGCPPRLSMGHEVWRICVVQACGWQLRLAERKCFLKIVGNPPGSELRHGGMDMRKSILILICLVGLAPGVTQAGPLRHGGLLSVRQGSCTYKQ